MSQASGASNAIYALARWFCYIGGTIMTALAIMSVYSVAIRAIGFKPVQGDFELVQIGCAVAVALFLPWCQLKGGNIIVDFFTTGASQRTQSRLDAFGALTVAVVLGVLAWRTGVGAVSVREAGESSMLMGVPIWWAYAGMVPGLALAAVAGVVTALEHLRYAAGGTAPTGDQTGDGA
jgi:TRAP-type C4-dicarboxylate transport system permease small subunit